jgi:hypothetical protein
MPMITFRLSSRLIVLLFMGATALGAL